MLDCLPVRSYRPVISARSESGVNLRSKGTSLSRMS